MEYTFRPLEQWPWPSTRNRKRAPFRVDFRRILGDLDRELRHLQARSIVFQADVTHDDIRLDGMLRANASVRSPRIILSFISKHGALSYPCDTYAGWQDNLRAICLALAALRAVDRYGVTKRAEQYRGWESLPPPAQSPPADAKSKARSIIEQFVGGAVNWANSDAVANSIRTACAKTHPDHGGRGEDFKQVVWAKELLGF